MTKSTDTLINCVIDASGSMASQVQPTTDGFNALLADQAALPGLARMSLTLFDTSFDARFVAKKLTKVPPLGTPENPYRPSGMTALLDAVGTTIRGTEAWIAAHPNFDGRVVCVVMTDGQENSSRQWHINLTDPQPVPRPTPPPAPAPSEPWVAPGGTKVRWDGGLVVDCGMGAGLSGRIDSPSAFSSKRPGDEFDLGALISAKRAEGWEFLFLGAGGSDWLEQTFGAFVPKGSVVASRHTAEGYLASYGTVSSALTRSRVAGEAFAVTSAEADALR